MPKHKSYRLFIKSKWKSWRYKNTFLLLTSLVVFAVFSQTPYLDTLIKQIGELGYMGAFLMGVFFVSTFTVAPASVVLFHLAGFLNPYEIALLAGVGAVVGDYLVFRLVKDRLAQEWKPLFKKFEFPRTRELFRSPYFAWLSPVIGSIIIASPLPDEIGVGMLGTTKLKSWQFFILTFILNATGIFFIVLSSRLIY